MDDLKINLLAGLTDDERTAVREALKKFRDDPKPKILPIDTCYGPGAPGISYPTASVQIDTKVLARELIDGLFDSGDLTIMVIKDQAERDMYLNAHKAFSVLHDILWGEFYERYIHHGDCSEFKTPYDAIDAYRKFIGDCISDRGIGELI